MHFSIPDSQECSEPNGSTFVGYNLHINGKYHCTVRYKQLHNLNEQLKKAHGADLLPSFPPKKFLPLSANQLEERRSSIEKYFQTVGQTSNLVNSNVFNSFLLAAQQESFDETVQQVTVDVYKMNSYKISVRVNSNERSDVVLQKVCDKISLPKAYVFYFSLFLIKREDGGDFVVSRKLMDFESPYISLKTMKEPHKIMIRKSYWDPMYDLELMTDKVALDLLYIQTVSDVERGWVVTPKNTHSQLSTLQARGAKKEYLTVARTLKYYGYLQFKECVCDYPQPGSKVIVSAGVRELNFRLTLANGDVREAPFKVTRMRCWKITTHNDVVETDEEPVIQKDSHLELSFEYLVAKEKLQWITISSDQAILMSICLQSIVDELIIQKSGDNIRPPGEYFDGRYSYMRRDGSSQIITLSQSSSADTLSSVPNGSSKSPIKSEPTMSMKKLSEKLSNLGRSTSKTDPFVENDAFEGIGDEDL